MRPYFLAFGVWLIALSAARANAVPAIVREPGADPSVGFMLVNAGAGIPQNGALLFEGPYDLTLMVDVLSAQGSLRHEGTLTPIEDSPFWVWVPEEPLPLGTLEVSSWSSDLGGLGLPTAFEVVPAIELGRPELMFAPSASSISVISNKRCCRERLNNSAMLIDGGHCFGVESESSIQVDPGVLTSSGQLQANQYLFRFSIGPDARPTFTTGSFRNVVLPVFTEQADEYCFKVSAIELPTLQELSYDELATCAEHGDLEALGTQVIEPSTTELSRVLCSAPPTGYEDAWCDANDDCGASEGSCKFYPHF